MPSASNCVSIENAKHSGLPPQAAIVDGSAAVMAPASGDDGIGISTLIGDNSKAKAIRNRNRPDRVFFGD
jgi:hypothetical protein